jgi:hypothetical protein
LNLKTTIAALAGAAVLALAGCGGDGDVEAFCDQADEAQALGADLAAPLQAGDLDSAKQAIDDASAKLDEVADSAPDEISDDIETVTDYVNDLNDSIQDANSPQDLLQLSQDLQANAEEVTEAGTNVETYISENCDEEG